MIIPAHTQDLHTHCSWDDGQLSIEALAASARKAGLTSLGVSVHTPMSSGIQACKQQNLPAFLDAVRAANDKYKKLGLRIYAGAEWDVLSTIPADPRDGLVSLSSFDYVIGSVHAITVDNPAAGSIRSGDGAVSASAFSTLDFYVDENYQKNKHMVNGYFKGDAGEALRRYYAQYAAVADNPYVKIVGHFDLPMKYCALYGSIDREYRVFSEDNEAYRQASDEAMQRLVDAGKIFELNTRTLMGADPEESEYRSWEWLSRLHQKGGRITVSSDTHHAWNAASDFSAALKLLRKSGFKEIMVLEETGREGKPVLDFVPRAI